MLFLSLLKIVYLNYQDFLNWFTTKISKLYKRAFVLQLTNDKFPSHSAHFIISKKANKTVAVITTCGTSRKSKEKWKKKYFSLRERNWKWKETKNNKINVLTIELLAVHISPGGTEQEDIKWCLQSFLVIFSLNWFSSSIKFKVPIYFLDHQQKSKTTNRILYSFDAFLQFKLYKLFYLNE